MTCRVSVALVTVCLSSIGAIAQTPVPRTFVSTEGSDANTASTCGPTTPCRSFAAAFTVTRPGGEIIPLTSGGYGALVVNQSVKIEAPAGIYVGITSTSGNGITVTAAATDTVVLKGLTIEGSGSGGTGISATTFGSLVIEDCTASGWTGTGITVNNATVPGATVNIIRSVSRGNGLRGFSLYGTILATMTDSRAEGNKASGIEVANGAVANLNRVVSTQNGNHGFHAIATIGSAELNCDSCFASHNGTGNHDAGFDADASGRIRVARSTSVRNLYGFFNGGAFESLSGTNFVKGNTTDVAGTITSISPL